MLLCRHPGNTGRHIYCMWLVAVRAERLSRHRSVWGIGRYCVKAAVFSHLGFVGFVYEVVVCFFNISFNKTRSSTRVACCDIKALTWQSGWIISQHASDFLKTRSRLAASPPTGPLHGHISVFLHPSLHLHVCPNLIYPPCFVGLPSSPSFCPASPSLSPRV